jgi:hypothetical protein
MTHTFTVRSLKLTTGTMGTDTTQPDDVNSLILQGDFLLNGNLRVPGEAKIDFAPPFDQPSTFAAPPPQLTIHRLPGPADLGTMLLDWPPRGIVINFDTGGDVTTDPPLRIDQVTRLWITFLRTLA